MSGTNFFEFRENLTKRSPAPPAPAGDTARPMTVLQLTNLIERAIRSGLPASVLVQGEVSNFNHHHGSGHLYFTLKDDQACIDCVMFRSDAQNLKFSPQDGMEMIAGGRVAVYPARGRYQLYVSTLHPVGRGALEVAFRQLYAKLKAQGLFAAERKRPIPRFPMGIALVTSRQTAALQDMLKVLRRFGWLRLWVYHVAVQGEGSAEQIAAAIEHLNRRAGSIGIEVILLGRGGGSLEDLWEFNDEIVARAIAASRIPIITGIGHEVDVSIADLVADHHAHTPTEAAQFVTAHWRAARDHLILSAGRLLRSIRASLHAARHRLREMERHEVFRRPLDRINLLRLRLDDRQRALASATRHRLRREQTRLEKLALLLQDRHPRHRIALAKHRLEGLSERLRLAIYELQQRRQERIGSLHAQLEALSPYRVLSRGYSMTIHKKRAKPIKSAKDLRAGDHIVTHFVDGSVESTVDDPDQPSLFE